MTNKHSGLRRNWRLAIIAISAILCFAGIALASALTTQSALAQDESTEPATITVNLKDPQGYWLGTSQSLDKKTYRSGDDVVLSWRGAANGSDFVIPTSISYGSTTVKIDSLNKVDDMQIENSEYVRRMGQSQAITNYATLKDYVTAEHFYTIPNVTLSTDITITWQKVRPVYRMYNMITSEHLFTTNKAEYDNLVRLGYSDKDFWIGEGINWLAPAQESASSSEVHRFYNEGLGGMGRSSHYYSADEEEMTTLKNNGWVDDGVDNQILSGGETAIWTCYNEALGSAHHYTSNKSEWQGLEQHQWDLEKDKNGDSGVFKAVMGTSWSFSDNFYTVRHNLQNADGEGYTTYTQSVVEGKAGVTTAAKANDYTGFVAPTKIDQVSVAADNSTIIDINYDRATYSLTFNSNGGSEVKPADTRYGDFLVAPTAPTNAGRTFAGWYYDEDCTDGNAVNWGRDTMPLGGVSLYAKWIINEEVTVTFDMQGKCTNVEQTIAKGEKVETFTPECASETLEFEGWYKEPECTTEVDFTQAIDVDTTYYAKWTEYVTVTFNMQEQCDDVTKTVVKGETVTEVEPECQVTGYKFGGWYKEETCQTKVDFTQPITQDIEFFAKWQKEITVTFEQSGHGSEIEAKTTYEGETVTQPTDAEVGTAQGLKFEGWYTSIYRTEDSKFDFATPLLADTKLYANWVPDSDSDVYWLGPARIRVTGNTDETIIENANYIKEEWNVKKSSAELKADIEKIKAGDEATIEQYKEWMNCECYHLYTKWNGDKVDGSGKANALNGYAEFRILQVGSHDGDTAAITFQSVYELPAGSAMSEENGYDGGWYASDLRAELQAGGNIYKNFNETFTNDIATIAKKTTAGNKSKDVKTVGDKFFLTSLSEIIGTSNSTDFVEEGSQYDYYKLMKLDKGNSNLALERGTRSSTKQTQVNPSDTESESCEWWTRTASLTTEKQYQTVDEQGDPTSSQDADSVYGVVPTFAFGTDATFDVTFDMQGRCDNVKKEKVTAGSKIDSVTPSCSVSGLKFEGWYKDAKCSASAKFDFDNDVVDQDMTLYANWAPDNTAYWLAPASTSITSNASGYPSPYNNKDNYSGADRNIKKTAEEIQKDVETLKNSSSADYQEVKEEYEGYMKNDNFHLYTKWNGDTKDADGNDSVHNGFVEFRIINVGSHDGDTSVLTFQSAFMLPAAYAMIDNDSTTADWTDTDLRKRLQPATQSSGTDATTSATDTKEGEIYNNFDANFTKDIMTSSKKYISGYAKSSNSSTSTAATEVKTEIKTSADKFFVLSNSEIASAETATNATVEADGAQYAFYKNLGVKADNTNSALWLLTRACDWNPTDSTSEVWSGGGWWQRTPKNYALYKFTQAGHISADASVNSKYGVVPCFAFGTDAKDASTLNVTLDSTELTYDNTEKEQKVSTVKDGDATLTENTDYKVLNNKATTDGEHTLTIVGLGKYAGTKDVKFTIKGSSGTTSDKGEATVYDSSVEGENKQVTVTVTADNEKNSSESVTPSNVAESTTTDSAVSGATVTAASGVYTVKMPSVEGKSSVKVKIADSASQGLDNKTVNLTNKDDFSLGQQKTSSEGTYTFELVKVTFNTQGHGNSTFTHLAGKGATVAEPKVEEAGTFTGLKFEGWYEDEYCKTKYDFTKTIDSEKTLYANWTADTDTTAYWLAPASSSITTNSHKDWPIFGNNGDKYTGAENNVKKTADEIKKDVETLKNGSKTATTTDAATTDTSNYDKVKQEYEKYMTDDSYHLYTKWNGDTSDSKGEASPSNGYVEFRIINVGAHDDDGSVLTFQSAYLLPVAYSMQDKDVATTGGWGSSDLRTKLQPASSEGGTDGEIFANFNSDFTKEIATVQKKYNVNATSATTKSTTDASSTAKTSNDKFFLLSYSEITGKDYTVTESKDTTETDKSESGSESTDTSGGSTDSTDSKDTSDKDGSTGSGTTEGSSGESSESAKAATVAQATESEGSSTTTAGTEGSQYAFYQKIGSKTSDAAKTTAATTAAEPVDGNNVNNCLWFLTRAADFNAKGSSTKFNYSAEWWQRTLYPKNNAGFLFTQYGNPGAWGTVTSKYGVVPCFAFGAGTSTTTTDTTETTTPSA